MAGRVMKVLRMPVGEASRIACGRVRKAFRQTKPYVLPILLMPLGMTTGMVTGSSGIESTKSKKEIKLKGIAVTDKIAIGTALVFDEVLDLKKYPSVDLKAEAKDRGISVEEVLEERMGMVVEAFRVLEENFVKDGGETAQKLNLLVMDIKTHVLEIMKKKEMCARDAVEKLLGRYDESLKVSESEKLRCVYVDIYQMCAKMLSIKHKKAIDVKAKVDQIGRGDIVIIADEISPSDVGLVNDKRIKGMVREKGSRMDHMSLRMINRGRVGLVGVVDASRKLKTGDKVIIDGISEKLILNPSKSTLRSYRLEIKRREGFLEPLKSLRGQPAKLLEAHTVKLMGNAANPEEVKKIREQEAEGVGLVRTEFFFIYQPDNSPRSSAPTVEEQIEFYNSIIAAAQGRELIIRTIDPDKDKSFPYFEKINGLILGKGKRGLAVCLDREDHGPYHFCFRNQLKALLQTRGKIKIMFPLVKSENEFLAAMEIVDEVREDLEKEGVKVNKQIKFGIMVEHPDILADLSKLAENEKLSFFSLGTNDLTQYVTKIDRYSEVASQYFDELDPRVLDAIEKTIALAKGEKIKLSLCGDMGNDWRALLVLLGMGLRKVSFSASFMDVARKIVLSVFYKDLKIMVENVKKIKTAKEIRKYIEEFTRDKIRSGRWAGLKEIESILFEE